MSSDGVFVISTVALRRAIVALLALVVVGVAVYYGRGFIGRTPAATTQIDHSAYQVVWLTTGQAFYGRLAIADADTYLLTDIYYVVTNGTGQPDRLIKRGAEAFGPREPMVLLSRQVLFFENLRDDSEIVSGIRAIQSGQGGAPPLGSAAPAATATPSVTGTARPSASR